MAVSSHVLKCNLTCVWKHDRNSVSASEKASSLEDMNINIFGRENIDD